MFRDEAIEQRRDKLSGNVAINVPISWRLITLLITAALAAAVGFLAIANYSRVTVAYGSIVPDKGLARIEPQRPGIVSEIGVKEGDMVKAGDHLLQIRTDEDSRQILSSTEQLRSAIGLQDSSLAAQMVALDAAASAQINRLNAEATGLLSERTQIESQISLQNALIETATSDLDRAKEVAKRGFISDRDLQAREENLLVRRQGMSELERALTANAAAIATITRTKEEIAAQSRAQTADLSAARAQVEQQAVNAARLQAYSLRAPISGTVTAVSVNMGQSVAAGMDMLVIIPSGSRLQAELNVPTTAIAFLAKGQDVNLAIDAFPFEKFGTITGQIIGISKSTLEQRSAGAEAVPSYRVRVAISAPTIDAFGKKQKLVPGMELSARIKTEDRSLLEWLFEPIFAVQRR